MGKKREIEYYIHIPFCVKKCNYCDFLSFPAGREKQTRYVRELCREMESWKIPCEESVLKSVFIGGGTPSVLPAKEIETVLKTLYRKYGIKNPEKELDPTVEITIECNPGTVDEEKLKIYRKAGINRISFGLQSADQEELQCLGRIHTWEKFLESYQLARKAGFENINVDLMSALPGQTLESWDNTLMKVLELNPEHISAYSLIIEEGTPFCQMYGEEDKMREKTAQCRLLPSEETERTMYRHTEELLTTAGYVHYEVSNYGKPGKECRHNVGYWTRVEYKGFGLGASSLVNNVRDQNTENLEDYLEGRWNRTEKEVLTVENQMEETMFLGLRMIEGVSKQDFQTHFGCSLEKIYGDVIDKYIRSGHMRSEEGRVYLTKKGQDISNYILADFLLD